MTYSRRQLFGFFGTTARSAASAIGLGTGSGESAGAAEAYEAALEVLSTAGPEYGGSGLSNHGPMVADALVELGRRLDERPRPGDPISSSAWREALGDFRRAGDWAVFFRRSLAENPWRPVLGDWTARLAPGASAAAFHGLIRTAHAARALSRREAPARVAELAEGLAYWAARYQELPDRPDFARRPRGPAAALADVELLAVERRRGGSIAGRLEQVGELPRFARVAGMADTGGDIPLFLSDLAETFARVYMRRATDENAIALVHAITGPSAVRLLLPFASSAPAPLLAAHAWQGAAAIYVGYAAGNEHPARELEPDDPREMAARAVATRDEHAIKLVEACLREDAVRPRPVFLAVAQDAAERFRPVGP